MTDFAARHDASLPPQAADVVVRVSGLTKTFGAVTAVDGISFAVRAGSVTGLLGGNGAGKTTTIAMLLGLLTPTAGSIEILGQDLRRNRYSVLPFMNFSSPYVDLPSRLTVFENLSVYAGLYGLAQPGERIDALARGLAIADFLDRPFGKLSAGQKTRVTVAKALLNQPKLLLLDEPTASLDPDTADWIRSYLERYRAETGATLVLASHNMREVERLCDHVLMMSRGSIVAEGHPRDLITRFTASDMEEVFLRIARSRVTVVAETG